MMDQNHADWLDHVDILSLCAGSCSVQHPKWAKTGRFMVCVWGGVWSGGRGVCVCVCVGGVCMQIFIVGKSSICTVPLPYFYQ